LITLRYASGTVSLASWKGPGVRQFDGTGVPGFGGGGMMLSLAAAGVNCGVVVGGCGSCLLR
jgi:hypothetical protein